MVEERVVLRTTLIKLVHDHGVSRTWQARRDDGQNVAAHELNAEHESDARGDAFRRIGRTLFDLASDDKPIPCLLRVHAIAEDASAYISDLWTVGTVADMKALGWDLDGRLRFVLDVCTSLRALHARNVFCGRLRPETVLFTDDLRPVLTEVGLFSNNWIVNPTAESDAAPETSAGLKVDVRSDVYAAGRFLQFVLGDASSPETSEELPRLTTLAEVAPGGLVRIVRRAVLADPDGRYPDIDALVADLHRYADLTVGLAHPEISEADLYRAPASPPAATRTRARLPSLAEESRAESAPNVYVAKTAPRDSLFGGLAGGDFPPRIRALVGVSGGVLSTAALLFSWQAASAATPVLAAFVLGGALAAAALPGEQKHPLRTRVALAIVTGVVLVSIQPLSRVSLAGGHSRLGADDASTRAQSVQTMVARGELHFEGMHLPGAKFAGAWFVGVSFAGADLTDADFSRATMIDMTLHNAKLRRASFGSANLGGADMTGADVSEATGFEEAFCSAETRLPEGWECEDTHPKHGS